jgi:hypothetical protein
MVAYTEIDRICTSIRTTLVGATCLFYVDTEDGVSKAPTILDKDEDPAVIADSPAGLPAVLVMPLGDRPDSINYSMGSSDWEHQFNVVIVGYYRTSTPETQGEDIFADIAAERKRAYDCAELFKGSGAFFTPGVIYRSKLELGYFEMVDYVIYKFIITLSIKLYEV